MAALKIITLNTGSSMLLGGLLSIIRIENPDIVLLQELTVTTGQLQLFVAKYNAVQIARRLITKSGPAPWMSVPLPPLH